MSLSVDPIFRSTQAPYSPSDPTCSSGKPETTFNGGVGSACTPLIIRGGRRKSVRRSVRKTKKSVKGRKAKKTRSRKIRGGGNNNNGNNNGNNNNNSNNNNNNKNKKNKKNM